MFSKEPKEKERQEILNAGLGWNLFSISTGFQFQRLQDIAVSMIHTSRIKDN